MKNLQRRQQELTEGFNNKENHNRYVTLSRTTTLSRQLSIFFKYFINDILKNAKFHIDADNHASERKTTIIYSGGDDVFVVGAWDDVIELGIDLKEAFEKYTERQGIWNLRRNTCRAKMQ